MQAFTLNIRGQLYCYDQPVVMGILNVTPDSFFAGSRAFDIAEIERKAQSLVSDGADIIDVGACSTRPGSESVSPEEECRRLEIALTAIRRAAGDDIPVSVDTFRADVARKAVTEWGADIINDISGGKADPEMFTTAAELHVPYILMHMRGTPATMQTLTDYADVTTDVIADLSLHKRLLEELGVADIIIDPGFGFAKTVEQNFQMLARLEAFGILNCPVLVGVSRKSMITRTLGINADEAETATAILGAYALEHGASILRVHDPKPARQSIELLKLLNATEQSTQTL